MVAEVESPNSFLQTLDNTIFRKMPISFRGHCDDLLFRYLLSSWLGSVQEDLREWEPISIARGETCC